MHQEKNFSVDPSISDKLTAAENHEEFLRRNGEDLHLHLQRSPEHIMTTAKPEVESDEEFKARQAQEERLSSSSSPWLDK
jgi:hypothetical protein